MHSSEASALCGGFPRAESVNQSIFLKRSLLHGFRMGRREQVTLMHSVIRCPSRAGECDT